MSQKRVYIMMIAATLFWSGAFIAGKLSVREFPPFSLTFFRFLIALPFIFAILYYRQPQDWAPRKQEWRPLLLLGVLGTGLYHVLFFTCLRYTTAINSSLIGSTNPMMTTLLAFLFFREAISRRKIAGILLSFTGVFLIITNADWQVLRDLSFTAGDVLMFAAAWCWAWYSVYSRYTMRCYAISPLKVTAYTFLICTLAALPFAVWEKPAVYLQGVTIGGWLSVVYMAIFASVLGYLFQLVAIQEIGAPRTNVFFNLVPVFTTIQSVAFLGETFTVAKMISACFVLTGVYIATRPEEPAAAVKSPKI
ncbi:MAG: DMT family transporter [Negativicutes bacterium]|nr:DMT family transporter [Negativicutes bacterium]